MQGAKIPLLDKSKALGIYFFYSIPCARRTKVWWLMKKTLYIIVPVYNEEAVLPITVPMFVSKLRQLQEAKLISDKSKILFVDDGSRDSTWNLITGFSEREKCISGVKLSRNRGHQNALLAGLAEASEKCDVTVTVDCDGQDDINAIDEMLALYADGCDVVYGVRKKRDTDTFFKRTSARGYYKLLKMFGVETVYDHADYRLMSARAVKALLEFKEVNLFLRGTVPLVGFKSASVYYDRFERKAGKSKYPLSKMIGLALNGITGMSVKPLRIITTLGTAVSVISFLGIIWSVVRQIMGYTVAGWASVVAIVCFLGGIQLLSLGVIGEYVGKIYLETKHRPPYIIETKANIDE